MIFYRKHSSEIFHSANRKVKTRFTQWKERTNGVPDAWWRMPKYNRGRQQHQGSQLCAYIIYTLFKATTTTRIYCDKVAARACAECQHDLRCVEYIAKQYNENFKYVRKNKVSQRVKQSRFIPWKAASHWICQHQRCLARFISAVESVTIHK